MTDIKADTQKQSSGEPLLDLIQIDHPALEETQYLVVNNEDIVHNGTTYKAVTVALTEPGQGEKIPRAEIVAGNVDLKLMDYIQSANGEPTVILKQIYASDPDTVVRNLGTFQIKTGSGGLKTIAFELSFDGLANKGYPDKVFDSRKFPGLF
mgnify:CR=1 FL=1